MTIKQQISHNVRNLPGWRTKRHIIVIESDDWGSVRMPSKRAFETLLKAGIRVDKCNYCSNDSIAGVQDLDALFDVLDSFKDINGNSACITANAVVANPNFEAIKESEFKNYFYTKITDGFKFLPDGDSILKKWKEGNDKGIFVIQSHGREHLNVSRWMQYLQGDYPETRLAFDNGVYGISTTITSEKRKSFLPAFDFDSIQEEIQVNKIAADGLRIFEEIFGFKSESFIAPNYTWGKSLERTLYENGVKIVQGHQVAKYINSTGENNRRRLRYIGRTNQLGQIDLSRNAIFEPSENPNKDWVGYCMKDIELAFRWHHPAIISSHRVNFVGTINPSNRDNGLKQLSELLKRIMLKWPDVEFMSSSQLGNQILKSKWIKKK